MPKQAGPHFYTGEFNGMIGYKIGDTYYFRKMPEKVHQTSETKHASGDFGTASSCGKLIRQALHNTMDINQDRFLTNRLNTIIAKILRADTAHKTGSKVMLPEHIGMLKDFSFNMETRADNVLLGLNPQITDDSGISINIPSIAKIKHTNTTTHIEIKAIALSANFAKDICKQAVSEAVMINVRKPIPPIVLTMPRPGNDATLIILQVRPIERLGEKTYELQDKKYLAADIIAVLPFIPLMKFKKTQQKPAKKKGKPGQK